MYSKVHASGMAVQTPSKTVVFALQTPVSSSQNWPLPHDLSGSALGPVSHAVTLPNSTDPTSVVHSPTDATLTPAPRAAHAFP